MGKGTSSGGTTGQKPKAMRIVLFDAAPQSLIRIAHQFQDAEILLLRRSRNDPQVRRLLAIFDPHTIMTPEVLSAFQNTVAESRQRPAMQKLSDRELTVLLFVTKGLTNREIARQLGLSERTTKGLIHDFFVRYDVSNRTELVGSD